MSIDHPLGTSNYTEAVHLLSGDEEEVELSDMTSSLSEDKSNVTRVDTRHTDDTEHTGPSSSAAGILGTEDEHAHFIDGEGAQYQVYKIRWFGLVQLVLLNIVVSWDVGTFSSTL